MSVGAQRVRAKQSGRENLKRDMEVAEEEKGRGVGRGRWGEGWHRVREGGRGGGFKLRVGFAQ